MPTQAGRCPGPERPSACLLTDVEACWTRTRSLISKLSVARSPRLIADGTISGGMIPKIRPHRRGGRRVHAAVILRAHPSCCCSNFSRACAGTLITAQ